MTTLKPVAQVSPLVVAKYGQSQQEQSESYPQSVEKTDKKLIFSAYCLLVKFSTVWTTQMWKAFATAFEPNG
jgi:hypothetical protein